jgi:hypothetical protein
MGRETERHENSMWPIQSLPGLFHAPLLPFSLPIPSDFLLPLEIEMLIEYMGIMLNFSSLMLQKPANIWLHLLNRCMGIESHQRSG